MLFKKSKNLVGLDIGSSAVKLVELKDAKGGGYRLVKTGIEPLSPEAIVDGAIMDASLVVDTVNRVISSLNVRNNDFATSLSGHSVIIKKISLPAMSAEELAESIRWEAEQYVPFDINDVNLDYVVLEPGGGETMDVLLVAVKKDKIGDYTSVITQAGKTPVLVDVDAFAVQNAYEINYPVEPGRVVALVNIGASVTNVNVLSGGNTIFWRDISFGGNQYTDAIQKQLSLGFEQADALKKGESSGEHSLPGDPPDPAVGFRRPRAGAAEDLRLLRRDDLHGKDRSALHRRRLLARRQPGPAAQGPFRNARGDHEPLPADRRLGRRGVGAVVERERPEPGGGGRAGRAAHRGRSHLIRINLLTEAKAAAARKKAPLLPTGAQLNNFLFFGGIGLGLLYVLIMGLTLVSRRSALQEEIVKARLEADRLKSIIEEVKEYEDKKASLEAKIQLINSLKTNQKGPVRLMDEISKALPDLVWLTSLDVTGNQISMKGKTLCAQRRGDVPGEPEEEPVLRGTRLQVARPRRRNIRDLHVGNDPGLQSRGCSRLRSRGPANAGPREEGEEGLGGAWLSSSGWRNASGAWRWASAWHSGSLWPRPSTTRGCAGSTRRSASSAPQLAGLQQEIQKGRAAERKLAQFREEIKRLELDLAKLLQILPSKRNTEDLIKRIETLTRQGDFTLRKFTPGEFISKDFYSEWPIDIQLEGTYHNLALFFDRMSRFSRIINVEEMRMNAINDPGGKSIAASFVAKTFIYTADEKGEAQERRRAPEAGRRGRRQGPDV